MIRIHDTLPKDLLKECKELASDVLFSPHLSASQKLGIRDSYDTDGIVLFHKIEDTQIKIKITQTVLDNEMIPFTPTEFGFSYMMSGSNLKWHSDVAPMTGSLTVFLNETWDENHGGAFVYKTGHKHFDNHCIYPEENLGILLHKDMGEIPHAVIPTSKSAPVRITLQLFSKK